MRRLVAVAALVAALLALTPVTPAHAADPVAEASMTASINQLRAGRGLPALGTHPILTAKAQWWASVMASQNRLYHSGLSDGITVAWNKLGENVGYGGDVNQIFQAFVASPPHLANMVDPAFQWIGVGVAYGGGRVWVAVEFMNGAAPPAPPAPPAYLFARGTAVNPTGGYYVFKGNGNVTPYDGAQGYNQPTFAIDIARGMAVMPDGKGYAILDGFGGVHLFGTAARLPRSTTYWPGWDIARAIAITPTGNGYVILDGFGGIHTYGDAPQFRGTNTYWPGWDIARDIAIAPDNHGLYVLDGWGGVHVDGTARWQGGPYWPGWNIARAFTLTRNGTGYAVLDGFGGVHVAGNAPTAAGVPYVPLDIWRGLAADGTGYVAVRADGLVAK